MTPVAENKELLENEKFKKILLLSEMMADEIFFKPFNENGEKGYQFLIGEGFEDSHEFYISSGKIENEKELNCFLENVFREYSIFCCERLLIEEYEEGLPDTHDQPSSRLTAPQQVQSKLQVPTINIFL